ncbi:hypothetical protein [Actinomadura sp. WMMB 499]|uniref:hypothetical protein n=1 Tax=Actinomadura sp. WMMB 499 TaxID=1219491 RepID=UPI00124569DC|nr:hypothetical protein [Actinomadura sp. WMMB 499]QFG21234.1 hypothetical protein F7P10_08880 [Actinomadura sp. WMMB 499]
MRDGYGSLGVSLGADTWFRCSTYPEKSETPILAIDLPGMYLSLSTSQRDAVSSGDVDNARRLLEVVSRFTAEVERLYAETNPQDSGEVDGGERAA